MKPAESMVFAEWMYNPPCSSVLSLLANNGYLGRFVGGAVRNHVLGLPVVDFDIATNALPANILALCTSAGLHAVPTGIRHGTITIFIDSSFVEVTTLRRDMDTDGRHAVVSFTEDWLEDASRRDFTLNAVYLDMEGNLYDPTATGIADIRARRIRFIGDPRMRIHEDCLRILRFFRFYAEYGHKEPDIDSLKACVDLAPSLSGLSGERIWKEFSRLLIAPMAAKVIVIMAESGIAKHLWDGPFDVGQLIRFINIERYYSINPNPISRLAALLADSNTARSVSERLKFSNVDAKRLASAIATSRNTLMNSYERKTIIYRFGAKNFINAKMLLAAKTGENIEDDLAIAKNWIPPVFPLRGNDVLALGIKPGPKIGELLRLVENWWITGGFTADEQACRLMLRRMISNTKIN
ncbi:poly A polymerase head domain protein [Candidatus Endolissoclinum faulkneri L2]|uniref:Poly A polymerase head domain protein n=1 Tax=Candidatus Endolissoclinum faulkneri L2 TaxID=1193729 RepID=K7YNM3_9PROT|nr:CCA tRNA nucleotidyltransferase [Candidatus Endolissoclinum faulkneri]AFX99137.1 poly A polymerase head domain protein [Candidatus Endolissoclinum faulkneri L2]